MRELNTNPAIHERLKTRLKARLLEVLTGPPGRGHNQPDRHVLEAHLQQSLQVILGEARAPKLTPEEERRLVQDVVNDVTGLGPLDPLLADDTVSEIMVNGPEDIYVERRGMIERVPARFQDSEQLMAIIERMLGSAGRAVNESDPICDASLPDGSRINVIIPPLVLNGPVITIRRKSPDWSMKDYVQALAISDQAAEFLEACMKAKVNLVISGGTSTGKTTLVTILSAFIPPQERIITIENVAELTLHDHPHWIRLVAKAPNVEGRGEIILRTLVHNALRMRPDRIILGEARGGEALDVVQAMHTGHEGMMTVLHANSPQAALERLETLMLMSGVDLPSAACRAQIASVVEVVVHLGRFADGSRRIAAITQVLGASADGYHLEDLFVFQVEGFGDGSRMQGTCRYTGARPKVLQKFQANNIAIPAWLTT